MFSCVVVVKVVSNSWSSNSWWSGGSKLWTKSICVWHWKLRSGWCV